MAKDKTSFVLYTENKEVFDSLSDEQAGKLIKHIFSYVNDENPTSEDQLINIAFVPIKQNLKRDLKKWESKQLQRSEAGKRSAEIRKESSNETKRPLTTVKKTPTKSTVNVNGNVNGNDILKEKQDQFKLEVKENTKYSIEMLKAFYTYWCEPTTNKTKMRKELEKTWSTSGRLLTWNSRQNAK